MHTVYDLIDYMAHNLDPDEIVDSLGVTSEELVLYLTPLIEQHSLRLIEEHFGDESD